MRLGRKSNEKKKYNHRRASGATSSWTPETLVGVARRTAISGRLVQKDLVSRQVVPRPEERIAEQSLYHILHY